VKKRYRGLVLIVGEGGGGNRSVWERVDKENGKKPKIMGGEVTQSERGDRSFGIKKVGEDGLLWGRMTEQLEILLKKGQTGNMDWGRRYF